MAMVRLREMLVYGRMRMGLSAKMVAKRMRIPQKEVDDWERGEWLPPLYREDWGRAVGCPDPRSTLHHCACPKACGASLDGLAWLDTMRPMLGARKDLAVFDTHTRERAQCLSLEKNPGMYREVNERVFRFWPVHQEAERLAFAKEWELAGNAYAVAASTVEDIRIGSRSYLLEKAMDCYRQDPAAEVRAVQLAMKYLTRVEPGMTTEGLKVRLRAYMDPATPRDVVTQKPTQEEDHG